MEGIESGGELMVPGGWTFLGEERLWAFVWPRRQCSLQQTEKEQSLNFILPLLWLNWILLEVSISFGVLFWI